MTVIQEHDYENATKKLTDIKSEIQSFIVGQDEIIDQVLWGIISQGHILLEGLPGLGKTMLVRTISEVMDLSFSRIQFTPDLMPSDITGTMMIQPDSTGKQNFELVKGPLFSNVVLADEINRATPKTQSALLEAMGERTVTIMGDTRGMLAPFFVLATQNPIDLEGTYALPEAQLDRFTAKVLVEYPTPAQLKEIVIRTTGSKRIELTKMITKDELLFIQKLVKEIIITEELIDLAIQIVSATQPNDPHAPTSVKKYIEYGSGPRGLQSVIHLAKARALCDGRYHVSIGDIKTAARPALRHRMLLNFEGEASGVSTDEVLNDILTTIQKEGSR